MPMVAMVSVMPAMPVVPAMAVTSGQSARMGGRGLALDRSGVARYGRDVALDGCDVGLGEGGCARDQGAGCCDGHQASGGA